MKYQETSISGKVTHDFSHTSKENSQTVGVEQRTMIVDTAVHEQARWGRRFLGKFIVIMVKDIKVERKATM